MVDIDIPGSDFEINIPLGSDPRPSGSGRAGSERWDGKGKPPSREAARRWLKAHTNLTSAEVKAVVGEKGTLTDIGRKVRAAEARFRSEGGYVDKRGIPRAKDGSAQRHDEMPKGSEKASRKTQAEAIADEMGLDDEQADELADLLGGDIGIPEADTRGAPLWRFEGPPEQLETLTVENNSWTKYGQNAREGRLGAPPQRTGARYYEQDTLEPLKWSAEQRADLQKVLQGIGLYGDSKVKLGTWSAKDQAIYAELLASANEEGRTWYEMLQKWKRDPPTDLLEEITGEDKRAPLVIQHTNPVDVQETAREVSRGLIGREDRGFIEGTPRKYNEVETMAQTAAYNAADPDGGGGTVTDAPSVSAYASDALRRSKPAEVDSYSTLGAFNEMLRELGLAG